MKYIISWLLYTTLFFLSYLGVLITQAATQSSTSPQGEMIEGLFFVMFFLAPFDYLLASVTILPLIIVTLRSTIFVSIKHSIAYSSGLGLLLGIASALIFYTFHTWHQMILLVIF
jgi:hypothetical protein